MKVWAILIATVLILSVYSNAAANDKVELKTTFIKGNKELPQVLYIVPWRVLKEKQETKKTLVLHSLFGDAFEPVTPQKLGQSD